MNQRPSSEIDDTHHPRGCTCMILSLRGLVLCSLTRCVLHVQQTHGLQPESHDAFHLAGLIPRTNRGYPLNNGNATGMDLEEGRTQCLHTFPGRIGGAPKLYSLSSTIRTVPSLICGPVESAMRAATHIMNDDLESAEAGLANGASSFHKVWIPASRAAWSLG